MRKIRRGDRLPPFVALTWEMLNSKAYKDLSSSPAKALPYFLGKVKTGFNDPQRYLTSFSFSYSEGKRLGFATATFSKTIQTLTSFGFIDPVYSGGLRGYGFSVSLFRLSERWKNYGTKEFKEVNWKYFCLEKRA